MADIGKRNTLPVIRETAEGIFLDAGDLGEALLPKTYIPRGAAPASETMDVFLFRDKEGYVTATPETPLAQAGDFAALKVMNLIEDGAVLAWGLQQELVLPYPEQEHSVEVGDRVVVYLTLDAETDQIYATSRLGKHTSTEPPPYAIGDHVALMVVRETPLGYIALVENAHLGLLYHSTLKELLQPGQKLQGYIGAIRPDGKIDLTLESSGYHRVTTLTRQIVTELKACGGQLDLDDESSPEAIRTVFGASKKAYKQALGILFKQRRIRFTKPGIALVN